MKCKRLCNSICIYQNHHAIESGPLPDCHLLKYNIEQFFLLKKTLFFNEKKSVILNLLNGNSLQ